MISEKRDRRGPWVRPVPTRLVAIAAVAGILSDLGAPPAAAAGAGPGLSPPAGPLTGAPPGAADDDPLTVQILTFGPGSHPFTRFGHNALRIIDRGARSDTVYNFGTFTFDSPRLIIDFLQGRLRYWLARSSMRSTVRVYQRENRSIDAQELDLTPAEKRELVTRLEVNARPENKDYRYDYFADNCSTRVRDALDALLGGRVRAAASEPGTMSLRAHALRMAADDLPLYLALLIILGPRTDRPVDQWAEAFLPEMLERMLRRVPGRTGALPPIAGGAQVAPARADLGSAPRGQLVSREQVLFKADRPPARREPPKRSPFFLGAGLVAGLIMFSLGRLGARRWVARALFGGGLALVGLVVGVVGCFLVGTWAFTPHQVAYANENIFQFAPFAIALPVWGLGLILGRPGAIRRSFVASAACLGLALLGCAWKLLPWAHQENTPLVLLMLPLWWGITAGARALAVAMPAGPPVSTVTGTPPRVID